MKISIACDHGGYSLKEKLRGYLDEQGHEVIDRGCESAESVDYPDYGEKSARDVAGGAADRAILICKSGIGMSIVANKLRGVRAALCLDEEMADSSRRHNDANVLVLSATRSDAAAARRIVETWCAAPFEGGRHGRRVDKIRKLEER